MLEGKPGGFPARQRIFGQIVVWKIYERFSSVLEHSTHASNNENVLNRPA